MLCVQKPEIIRTLYFPLEKRKMFTGMHRELRNAEMICNHIRSCEFTLSKHNETTTPLWTELYLSQNAYVEVLIPTTSECDCT